MAALFQQDFLWKGVKLDAAFDPSIPNFKFDYQKVQQAAANLLDVSLGQHYAELKKISTSELIVSRYNKFRNIAQFFKTES